MKLSRLGRVRWFITGWSILFVLAPSIAAQLTPAPLPVNDEVQTEDFERSELLKSKDKGFIVSRFRTMCVNADKAEFFGADQMKAALGGNRDFAALNVTIVDNCSLADTALEVGYTFAWDYPFSLKHHLTSIVLVSGIGYGPFSGPEGAASVARELAKLLKPYRASRTVNRD